MSPLDHIRSMEIGDLPRILEIEAESFTSPWTEASFLNELANPKTYYYVWQEDENIVGYAGFWKIFEEINITNIAIAKAYRGRGIGSAFVAYLKEKAGQLGAKAISLEVRQGNRPAIATYQKNGFYTAGIRKNYYTKPSENALIMWAELKKEDSHEDGRKSN